jgi:general secretion pathway protein A
VAQAAPASAVPGDAWFEDQHLRAWEGLAAAWGRPADGALIEATCQGRAGLGYACLRDQGNLRRIRELGLPVVLALRDDTGGRGEQHLLLRGLGDGRLRVGTAADEAVVDADAIGERWYGDYFVAWPQAANWPREVERGDAGPAVDTILELAAAAEPPYRGAARFDAEFERWLTEFQQRQGLNADGIVGPKTLLYLMRFSIAEPRLLGVAEGGG